MPGAHTHDRITLVSGIALAPVCWVLSPDHSLATVLTVTSAHLISGLVFSCDLDIDSLEYRRWGILRFIWWPYKETIPHRSWLSHGLVIGPLLRLAYFGLIVYGILWLIFNATGNVEMWQELQRSFVETTRQYSGQTYAFLIGFVTGGAAHSIPDWLTTGTKRAWNQWTKF